MMRLNIFLLGLLAWNNLSCQTHQEATGLCGIPIADPFVLYDHGRYYAYGTAEKGFRPYCSEDLKHWTRAAELCLKPEDSYGDHGFWAPETYYFSSTGKYYMYYTSEEHICVAVSDSPLGPFVQENKEPILAEKCIDPSVFVDDSGKAYIFFVRFTDGNVIWSAELSEDRLKIKENTLKECLKADTPWELRLGKVTEGPSVIRHKNKYYLLYSANDYRSKDYAVGYATSDSPSGPWIKYEGNPVLHSSLLKNATLFGTGHGAPFVDAEGGYRYIFHAHASESSVQPRSSYVTDLSFDKKGRLHIGDSVLLSAYR